MDALNKHTTKHKRMILMIHKEDFETMMAEMDRLTTYYTKEHDKEKDMNMRAYYFGKLDGIQHTRTMLIMAVNKYNITKSCLVSDKYNPNCDCEMCTR